MKGIPIDVMVHKLNVDPKDRTVKQKKRNIGLERAQEAEE